MTSRRKRRAEERKSAKAGDGSRLGVWTVVIIALAVLAIGLARSIW